MRNSELMKTNARETGAYRPEGTKNGPNDELGKLYSSKTSF